jgi:hypothetical protein
MIHIRVPLPYKIEDGVGDFLSPEALKVIGVDYQQGLLDRLNEQIKGACAFVSSEEGSCPTIFFSLLSFFFVQQSSHVRQRYQA